MGRSRMHPLSQRRVLWTKLKIESGCALVSPARLDERRILRLVQSLQRVGTDVEWVRVQCEDEGLKSWRDTRGARKMDGEWCLTQRKNLNDECSGSGPVFAVARVDAR